MIRQVQTDDWQRLRDVRLRALADEPYAFLETHAGASAFPEERWRERATPTDRSASFLYEREGSDEGMVSCFVSDAGDVVLVAMWVAPELRGTGAARELVEAVVDWARAHGRPRVVLSVEGENVRAAVLYEKCAFERLPEPPPLPYEPNPGNRFYARTP